MRTTLELLFLLLSYCSLKERTAEIDFVKDITDDDDHVIFDDTAFKGLCILVIELHRQDIISKEEEIRISNYLSNNPPFIFKAKKFFGKLFGIETNGYWYNPNNLKPRIKWLKRHINKLK